MKLLIFALLVSCSSSTPIAQGDSNDLVANIEHLAKNNLKAFDGMFADIYRTPQCSYKRGCRDGYCWAGCGWGGGDDDWCYTTTSYSQSYAYVECTSDAQCDGCWNCAGICS
ncbi:Allergen Tha p 2 [Eumeta japonica]|uniref:Allergen Tha p 2 n=1 Tax=Eumeta variegata TaxID=151549 RepID=A0A4C1VPM7_EUMVA|nr:Allergen Tha p 2 [Eumeta japonica]